MSKFALCLVTKETRDNRAHRKVRQGVEVSIHRKQRNDYKANRNARLQEDEE